MLIPVGGGVIERHEGLRPAGHNTGGELAFTRYCHYHYDMAYFAIKGRRGEMMYCATVWAMRGGERRGHISLYRTISLCNSISR